MSRWEARFDSVVRTLGEVIDAFSAVLHAYPGTTVVLLTLLLLWVLFHFP